MEQSDVFFWPRFQVEPERLGIIINLDSNSTIGTVLF